MVTATSASRWWRTGSGSARRLRAAGGLRPRSRFERCVGIGSAHRSHATGSERPENGSARHWEADVHVVLVVRIRDHDAALAPEPCRIADEDHFGAVNDEAVEEGL